MFIGIKYYTLVVMSYTLMHRFSVRHFKLVGCRIAFLFNQKEGKER